MHEKKGFAVVQSEQNLRVRSDGNVMITGNLKIGDFRLQPIQLQTKRVGLTENSDLVTLTRIGRDRRIPSQGNQCANRSFG